MKKVNLKNKLLGTLGSGALILSAFNPGITTFADGNPIKKSIEETSEDTIEGTSEGTSEDTIEEPIENISELYITNAINNINSDSNLSSKIKKPKSSKEKQIYEKNFSLFCDSIKYFSEKKGCNYNKVVKKLIKLFNDKNFDLKDEENFQNFLNLLKTIDYFAENFGLKNLEFLKELNQRSKTIDADLTEALNKLLNDNEEVTATLRNNTKISLSLYESGFLGFGKSKTLVINCAEKNCSINLDKKFLQILAKNNINYIVSEVKINPCEGYRWKICNKTLAWSPKFHKNFPNAQTSLGSQEEKNYYHYETDYIVKS